MTDIDVKAIRERHKGRLIRLAFHGKRPQPESPAADIAALLAALDERDAENVELRRWGKMLWAVAEAADKHAIMYLGEETAQMRDLRDALEPIHKALQEAPDAH